MTVRLKKTWELCIRKGILYIQSFTIVMLFNVVQTHKLAWLCAQGPDLVVFVTFVFTEIPLQILC